MWEWNLSVAHPPWDGASVAKELTILNYGHPDGTSNDYDSLCQAIRRNRQIESFRLIDFDGPDLTDSFVEKASGFLRSFLSALVWSGSTLRSLRLESRSLENACNELEELFTHPESLEVVELDGKSHQVRDSSRRRPYMNISSLTNAAHLRVLRLRNCAFNTDAIARVLQAQRRSLHTIEMAFSEHALMPGLFGFESLHVLRLRSTNRINTDGLSDTSLVECGIDATSVVGIGRALGTSLSKLVLDQCSWDVSLEAIVEQGQPLPPNLAHLYVIQCSTEINWRSFAQMKSLRVIHIEGSLLIFGAVPGLVHMIPANPLLEEIVLSENMRDLSPLFPLEDPQFDAELSYLFDACKTLPSLKVLDLTGIDLRMAKAKMLARTLPSLFPHLKHLRLTLHTPEALISLVPALLSAQEGPQIECNCFWEDFETCPLNLLPNLVENIQLPLTLNLSIEKMWRDRKSCDKSYQLIGEALAKRWYDNSAPRPFPRINFLGHTNRLYPTGKLGCFSNDILEKGLEAVNGFLATNKKEDVEFVRRAKLLVIGDAGVGKTTLLDALFPIKSGDVSLRGLELRNGTDLVDLRNVSSCELHGSQGLMLKKPDDHLISFTTSDARNKFYRRITTIIHNNNNRKNEEHSPHFAHGIDIHREQLSVNDGERPHVDVCAWDFAGQQEYRGHHRFIVSSSSCVPQDQSVYILVWDASRPGILDDLRFWLRTLKVCLLPFDRTDAPITNRTAIIIVGTHTDMAHTSTFNSRNACVRSMYESLQMGYPLKDYVEVCCIPGDDGWESVNRLKTRLAELASDVSGLPMIRSVATTHVEKAVNDLRGRHPVAAIDSIREAASIRAGSELPKSVVLEALARMNSWGGIIFFPSVRYCVLQPAFLTQETLAEVYSPFHADEFKCGRVKVEYIRTLWEKRLRNFGDAKDVFSALLVLLERMDFCFRDQDDHTLMVFPDRLPDLPYPPFPSHMEAVMFAFEVDYRPSELIGIIAAVASRELQIVEAARQWCKVTVKGEQHDDPQGELANGSVHIVDGQIGRKRLEILARAMPDNRPLAIKILTRLISAITEALERYPGMLWTTVIKAMPSGDKAASCDHWLTVQEVQRLARKELTEFDREFFQGPTPMVPWTYRCDEGPDWKRTLEYAGLLDPEVKATTPWDYDVFISHAGHQKGTIACHIQYYLRAAGISAFLDETTLEPGTNAHEVMRKQADSCPIFIAVLSADYFASAWCREELRNVLDKRDEWLETNSALKDAPSYPYVIPFFYDIDPNGVRYAPGIKKIPVRKRDKPTSVLSHWSLFRRIVSTSSRREQVILESRLIANLVKIVESRLRDLRSRSISAMTV